MRIYQKNRANRKYIKKIKINNCIFIVLL